MMELKKIVFNTTDYARSISNIFILLNYLIKLSFEGTFILGGSDRFVTFHNVDTIPELIDIGDLQAGYNIGISALAGYWNQFRIQNLSKIQEI
jgi:hypothetical protein